MEKRAFCEGSHDDDTEAEFFCEWEDPLFNNPLPWIVRDLDSVDPAGIHHHFEFVECARIEMGGTDEPDSTPVSFLLKE